MRLLFFDLIGGASGDMVVASLLDLGDNADYLKKELRKIDGIPYGFQFFRQKEGHIKMGRFIVSNTAKQKRIYQLNEIEAKIKGSQLSSRIKKNILRIYRALYRAEKKVHRSRASHFHQIGEIDSIIDIAAACILIDRLKVGRILYSSVPFGRRVAPATAELLVSKDIYFSRHPFENITPTGVAIITALGEQCAKNIRRGFIVESLGYGRGTFHSHGCANGLRAMLVSKKRYSASPSRIS